MTLPAFSSFPSADEHFTVATADGARLPVYGLRGPKDAPALLFGHANGLAAGSYAPWLARLARHAHVFAFDARGHGGAEWPEGPLATVFADNRMAEDVLAVTQAVAARLPQTPLTYVGHSLGAVAALRLLTLGAQPGWRAFIAFEPPVFPPPSAPIYAQAIERQDRLLSGTLRRRALWSDPEALYERLAARGPFARADAAMLMAHCRATLRPDGEGGYRLACPPVVEAAIFERHRHADTWSRLDRLAAPVELIGSDPTTAENDWVSRAMPEIAGRLPQGRLTVVPETGHMLIFEAPDRCAALVLERLDGR